MEILIGKYLHFLWKIFYNCDMIQKVDERKNSNEVER